MISIEAYCILVCCSHRVADKGHFVVGVEGSEKAVKEFFQEQNLEYKMDAINMAPRGALVFSVNILYYFSQRIFAI